MRPYASKIVPQEDLVLFRDIEMVVQEMPEVDLGGKVLVSCHMISRALARFFPVQCKDGYFGDLQRHSWLATVNGLIIDPYPVAVIGGPIFVDTRYITPWFSLYKESLLSQLDEAPFLEGVERVTEAVRETMDRLAIIKR